MSDASFHLQLYGQEWGSSGWLLSSPGPQTAVVSPLNHPPQPSSGFKQPSENLRETRDSSKAHGTEEEKKRGTSPRPGRPSPGTCIPKAGPFDLPRRRLKAGGRRHSGAGGTSLAFSTHAPAPAAALNEQRGEVKSNKALSHPHLSDKSKSSVMQWLREEKPGGPGGLPRIQGIGGRRAFFQTESPSSNASQESLRHLPERKHVCFDSKGAVEQDV